MPSLDWIELYIADVVEALYRDDRATIFVAAFNGLDSPVFFTRVCLYSGLTTISFVSVDREAGELVGLEEIVDLVLSGAEVGWFTG